MAPIKVDIMMTMPKESRPNFSISLGNWRKNIFHRSGFENTRHMREV